MPLTYSSYLKLDELLRLQQPLSEGPEHDEWLFITIHQVYELWFQQVLKEVDRLQALLEAGDLQAGHAAFRRILTILKVLVAQVDILETMTPISFQSFRTRLEAASGFQSLQFRDLEFALGLRRPATLAHHADTPGRERLVARLARPSLYTSFLRFLARRGYAVPADAMERDPALPPLEDERVRSLLVQIYRCDPAVRDLCERLVDLDEGFQEWRYRHVKMVERTIGSKPGTGGSPGAAYLRTTLFQSFFPDLWTIRSAL